MIQLKGYSDDARFFLKCSYDHYHYYEYHATSGLRVYPNDDEFDRKLLS